MNFWQELILSIVKGAVPIVLMIAGGKWLLDRYEFYRKRREQELELVRFVRQQQYEALSKLYELFAVFMHLYRQINLPDTNVEDESIRRKLLESATEAEGKIDATILRIACEFKHDNKKMLEPILADLRQSTQIWRERLRAKQKVPFTSSGQPDYVRFKTAFSDVSTYLAGKIYERLDPPELATKESRDILMEVFDNKHEW